jgi:hypothetical protein
MQSNLPPLSYEEMSETEIIQAYAFELPDTPWRRNWNERYKEGRPPESGGERIVNGVDLFVFFNPLSGYVCHAYCEDILRRGGDEWDESYKPLSVKEKLSDIHLMLGYGFYPVREPQDFDVVVYGKVSQNGEALSFMRGHSGLYKDGKVISKDFLSLHVYKHPVEESAAYSSHVMYFRHKTHPDPRDYPLPAPIGTVHFVDEDGIAMPVRSLRFYVGASLLFACGAYWSWFTFFIASKIIGKLF